MLDEDVADLVCQLCTRAGMIMEDVSVIAITARVADVASARKVTTQLQAAAERIGALAKAAEMLIG
ncbi:hypothetical protein [Sphingomonas sp. RB1R13]|uniref:hypothetical protein n=1 Tax=Sphingomonas sp. RB1R13 TaxID=3096159 RepID=UPI002FC59248